MMRSIATIGDSVISRAWWQGLCMMSILLYVGDNGRSGRKVPDELVSADGAALEAWKSKKLQGKVVQSK
jgi:hypothetical protein